MESSENQGLIQFSFETFGIKCGNEIYATRSQIQNLYKVPKKTLADNIAILKKDGLVVGAKIRPEVNDRKQRLQEAFNLDEIFRIGFRLSSDVAIHLQKYASNLLKEKAMELNERNKSLRIENDRLWDKLDRQDLY